MKCPYCNKEMEEGIIQSPQEISWKKGLNGLFSDGLSFMRALSFSLSCRL